MYSVDKLTVGQVLLLYMFVTRKSLKMRKMVIRSRDLKDRQNNCQKKKDKMTNSIDKIQYRKLKIEQHKLHQS